MSERPTSTERLFAPDGIGGIVLPGEFIILGPEKPGVLVARWLDWEYLPLIREASHLLVPAKETFSWMVPFPPRAQVIQRPLSATERRRRVQRGPLTLV